MFDRMTVYLLRQNKESTKDSQIYPDFNEENIIIIIIFLMCAVFISTICCKLCLRKKRPIKAIYVGYIEPGIPIFNLEGEQIR